MEKEREDMCRKMNDIQIQYQKFHDQEWELRRREDEIDALRRALSDAQLHIFDEREHSMHLQHQNDALKSKCIRNEINHQPFQQFKKWRTERK